MAIHNPERLGRWTPCLGQRCSASPRAMLLMSFRHLFWILQYYLKVVACSTVLEMVMLCSPLGGLGRR